MEPTQEFWNIDKNAGMLLQAIIHTARPMKILEIGTSNGYCAIQMGMVAKEYGGTIQTIEFFPERVQLAQENIKEANLSDTIEVLQGDAMEILPNLTSSKFDFIFIDANKEEYADYFKYSMQMISPGGIIIADNTVSHRNKLSAFFEAIKNEPHAHALELDIGTGLMVIRVS